MAITKYEKLSKAGEDLIKGFEGFVDHAYNDGVGIMTIGWGHAIKAGESFPAKISIEEADGVFRKDVQFAIDAVNKLVTVELSQNQFDALVSFVFNTGVGAFKNSTLLKELNSGNCDVAAEEFKKWNKGTVNGKKVELKGLTKRRNAESELFKTKQCEGAECFFA